MSTPSLHANKPKKWEFIVEDKGPVYWQFTGMATNYLFNGQPKTVLLRAIDRIQKDTKFLLLLSGGK